MEATTMESHVPKPAANERITHEARATPPRRARTRTILIIALVVLAVFAAFLTVGLIYRSTHSHQLASTATAAAQTPPQVYVIHPVASAAADWSVPGTTQAIEDSIIYARVSGYLRPRARIT